MKDVASAPLTREERRRLADLADVIAPRRDGMPSASDIGFSGEPLDRVLAIRPDLLAPLRHALQKAAKPEPLDAVRALQNDGPAQFAALLQVVAGAYYMDAEVRRRLNYAVRRRMPGADPRSPVPAPTSGGPA